MVRSQLVCCSCLTAMLSRCREASSVGQTGQRNFFSFIAAMYDFRSCLPCRVMLCCFLNQCRLQSTQESFVCWIHFASDAFFLSHDTGPVPVLLPSFARS